MPGTITTSPRRASSVAAEPFTRPSSGATPGSRYDVARYDAGRYDDPGSAGTVYTFGTVEAATRRPGTVSAS